MRPAWNHVLSRDLDRTFAMLARDLSLGPQLYVDRSPSPLRAWHGHPGPQLELIDEGQAWTITADVPGLSEEDLSIHLSERRLEVKGARKLSLPEGHKLLRRERHAWSFHRAWALPAAADADGATATITDGVLRVNVPKAATALPRQIAVTRG